MSKLLENSIVKRGITICTVAPLVMWIASDPFRAMFLLWFLTYVAMIEWTAMKRHLKVVLLSHLDFSNSPATNPAPIASTKPTPVSPTNRSARVGSSGRHSTTAAPSSNLGSGTFGPASDDSATTGNDPGPILPPFPVDKEFPYPVAPTNNFIRIKCFFSSLITPCAYLSPSLFFLASTAYFFAWVVMTLTFQNKAEVTAVIAKKVVRTRKNSSSDLSKLSRTASPNNNNDDKDRHPTPTPAGPLLSNPSVGGPLVDWEKAPGDAFILYELENLAHKPITEVFLSFCLEYFGVVWISGLSYGLLLAASGPRGHICAMIMLVSNWSNDIAALIVGKAMKGRTTPLYPRISPNKSTEGAIAGILANGVVGALGLWIAPGAMSSERGWPFDSYIHPVLLFFVVGIVFGILGVVGDLLQSLFKRTARIKDTGTFFPGHGGVLDRIDGLLLTCPPGYWLLWAFMAL